MVDLHAHHMSLPAAATIRLLTTSGPISLYGLSCAQPAGHVPITLLCPLLASWLCGHVRSGFCRVTVAERLGGRRGGQLPCLELCLLLPLPRLQRHACGCPLHVAAALLCLTGSRVAAVGRIRQQGAHAAKTAVGQLRLHCVSLVLCKVSLLALASKLLTELCIWRPREGWCLLAPMLPL